MSDHNADDHHGHAQLEYQPALPLPNGKVCLWLFLSTEIMFFAGLIGTYIVLRFGANVWPTPHDVHLSEPIGAFNTFVLICSSVTVVLALEAARASKSGQAKFWLIATFALGSVFLFVKAYEYKEKFAHGIYPKAPRSLIHEKPNLYYASAVRQDLAAMRSRIDSERGADGELSESQQAKIETIDTLLSGAVKWAEQGAARADNMAERHEMLRGLADAIYPTHGSGDRLVTLLDREEEVLGQEIVALEAKQRQLTLRRDELRETGDAGAAELSAVANQLDEIPADISLIKKRLDAIPLLREHAEHGLNHSFAEGRAWPWMILPMMIPSGNMWASTYFSADRFSRDACGCWPDRLRTCSTHDLGCDQDKFH